MRVVSVLRTEQHCLQLLQGLTKWTGISGMVYHDSLFLVCNCNAVENLRSGMYTLRLGEINGV